MATFADLEEIPGFTASPAPGTLYPELSDEVDWGRSSRHGAQPCDSVEMWRLCNHG